MNAIKSTPFSFLTAKEFDALEGFVWLLVHGNNTATMQALLVLMISKVIHPLEFFDVGYIERHMNTERELRTYPNGKPPLLTE